VAVQAAVLCWPLELLVSILSPQPGYCEEDGIKEEGRQRDKRIPKATQEAAVDAVEDDGQDEGDG
jgi:hypothetical protein